MGPAELLALRRKDVHLNQGFLDVTGDLVTTSQTGYRPKIEDTKTPQRRRRITLPTVAIEALRNRMKLCLAEGSGEYLFTTREGGLIRPSSLRTYWWRPMVLRAVEAAKKAKEPFPATLRFYDLRHTAAALMGLAGIPIEVVRDYMGHASIKLTVDTYGHILAGRREEAAQRIDSLVRGLRKNA